MKSNAFKYLFAIFVIALIGFAVYKIYNDKENEKNNNIVTESKNEEPKILNDLRMGIVEFDTMNPILSKNKNVQEISKLIFESLLTIDENYKLQNCLVKEWSKTEETSYLLKLRDDVKWHDGSKFTAKDVQFTIDRLKEIPSIYAYNVQHVIGVEIIDDYTVKINLDMPVQYFEYNLTFPIMSNSHYLGQDFSNSNINVIPVATGMYKVTNVDGTNITLKKNQNWWNWKEKNTKIETITISIYSSMGEIYNAFKIGNLDLVTTQSLNVEEYIGTIGFNSKEIKGREHDFLAFNCNDNILSRLEVRKAIDYAIDKNAIISNVYSGKYYISDFPLDYGSWLYSSEAGSIGFNPEQSKQILIDNGWQYKNKVWQKTENYRTIRLSLNIVVNSENDKRVAVANIIKSNLETIGINVKLINVNGSTYYNYLQNKNYESILTGINSSISPNLTTFFGENNLANYYNDESLRIMKEVSNITEENVLKEKYKRLSEIYKLDVPYISLYNNRATLLYSKNLMGDIKPNNFNIFYNIENWYREF